MSQYVTKIRTDKGDLPIDYNALANLPTISNPNLLINGDFRNPVNQRGQTTYKSTAGNFTRIFTVDRWNMQNGMTLTVNDASISLKGDSNSSGTCIFSQVLENCPQGDYTLQVKVLSSLNGSEVCIMNSASQAVLTSTLHVGVNKFTVTNTKIRIIQIHLAPNSEVELEWIKLEAGPTATAFSPRPYAEEVALCQRYYVKLKTIYPLMIAQRNNAGTSAYMFVPLPVTLRNAPSITFVNAKTMKNGLGGSFYDLTDVTCVGVCNSGVTLQVTAAENFEAGIPYFLILPESGYINFDAEIY